MNRNLVLYSYCILVSGLKRCAIYDLRRGKILFAPNSFFSLFESNIFPYSKLVEQYSMEDDRVIIDEYREFILNNYLGFETDNPDSFPPLNIKYEDTDVIKRAHIETYLNDVEKAIYLFNKLSDLGLRSLDLVVLDNQFISQKLIQFLEKFRFRKLRRLSLIILGTFDSSNIELFSKIKSRLGFVEDIIVLNQQTPKLFEGSNIYFLDQSYNTFKKLQLPNSNFQKLIVNMDFFMESHFYNPFYNKSVAFDKDGNIYNDICHSETYGNVFINSLKEILNTSNLTQLWAINNTMIEGLKESEIRYALLNIQIPIKISTGKYKLSYLPYDAEKTCWI